MSAALSRQLIGQSPFNTVHSFMAVATGEERITLREPHMIDLQLAIEKSGKLHDTLVMAKGAITAGADPAPILADAMARLPEVANALNHFADPIEDADDDAAKAAVEGHLQKAAE